MSDLSKIAPEALRAAAGTLLTQADADAFPAEYRVLAALLAELADESAMLKGWVERYQAGASLVDLAEEAGVDYQVVYRYVRGSGITMRPIGRPPGRKNRAVAA